MRELARSAAPCAAAAFLRADRRSCSSSTCAAMPLGHAAPRSRCAGSGAGATCLASWACASQRRGRPFTDCPTLFVANHVSYLDILVLGAVARRHLHRQVRGRGLAAVRPARAARPAPCSSAATGASALIQRNALAARMRAGESFVLFAEGTSSDGLGVRPFKTSLLSVAEPWILDCPVAVQPVTLAYAAAGRRHADRARPIATLRLARRCRVPAASVGCAAAGRRRDPRGRWAIRCCPGRCRAARCWVASCSGQLSAANSPGSRCSRSRGTGRTDRQASTGDAAWS